MNEQGRRRFLAGATGALVVGFDTSRRSWVTEAQASGGSVALLPGLDGELTTDPAALDEAADDFGHIVHRRPIAVLRPGSYDDIAKLLAFSNLFGIKLAGRGAGHSTFGQAQARGGFVIDMRTLAAVHDVSPAGAVVDAGVRWSAVLGATLPEGLTPPVLTDYIETTPGGTLSVGGIGGATHRHGLQIDNVEALEVVTGDGQLVHCSPSVRPGLFQSVLGGLGQFAVMVRTTLSVKPAPARARIYTALYTDLDAYVADQSTLALEERFDYLEGQIVPDGAGGWNYLLEAGAYYTPPDEPDDDALLAGLAFDQLAAPPDDRPYFDWLNRLAPIIEQFYIPSGFWFTPHPLCDLFLPASAAPAFVTQLTSVLGP
ncbi:MAG TPA: FAD-binding protein, partial [Polyangiaceae bacterium]|nr:FAD-binding protein [Polyangiaceae bacterium]